MHFPLVTTRDDAGGWVSRCRPRGPSTQPGWQPDVRRSAPTLSRGPGDTLWFVIELAELIGDLRAELNAARLAGLGEDLRFELGPVQLDVDVVEKKTDAGAKVRFWVFDLNADGALSTAKTQRISLNLVPRLREGADAGPEMSTRTPFVSGESTTGER